MIACYLKTIFRRLRKQKGYTFINISGLAIGLACCMIISLWILDELNHDKQYPDVDRIHTILINDGLHCPNALARFLQDEVPEIESAARTIGTPEVLVSSASLQSYEEYLVVDPKVIDLFSFQFVSGDAGTALAGPNSIVLTRAMASKFFPEENPLGKTLLLDNRHEVVVTGVTENTPHNSSLKFDMLVSVEYERRKNPDDVAYYEAWKAWSSKTYVKVHKGVTAAALTERIRDLVQGRFGDEKDIQLSAVNIADLYFRFSDAKKGVIVFAAIAAAILALACINFTNLSTARYRMRCRETGIRKVVGAKRSQLMWQFLGESFILTTIGFILALVIVELILPFFNSLFQLRLSLSLMNDPSVILAIIGVLITTALAAGTYPALLMSRYHPVQALTKGGKAVGKHFNLRRTLVIFQFTLTIFLVAGTGIVYTQIDYIKSWDVGYSREQVINIPLRGKSPDKYGVLKNELLKKSEVLAVTGVDKCLPYWHMFTTADMGEHYPDGGKRVSMNFAAYDFAGTYGLDFVEGRDFSREHATDLKHACLINETLARQMIQTPALGARINVWGEDREVIGVLKDFNFQPLKSSVEPLVIMMLGEGNFVFDKPKFLSVRISPLGIGSSIEHIRETWQRLLPDHPFEYSLLDEQFNEEYRPMEEMQNLAGSFGLLAVFIAGLGLFGLTSYTAEQRTKEIGIRKVLGATVTSIVCMLSRESLVLVALSCTIAWPLTWFAMNRWLNEFAYRTELSIGLFIAVGCFALIVALMSVSYQSIKIALTDPVDTLRTE